MLNKIYICFVRQWLLSKVFHEIYTRAGSITFFLVFLLYTGCQPQTTENDTPDKTGTFASSTPALIEKDLEQIRADGVLKAITIYSATSYFLYRGQPMGYEYELLQRLADYLELELEIVIAKNINQLFEMLNQGDADLVAYGMTITTERKEQVDFTEYLYLTRQVLVQKKPAGWRTMKRHEIQAVLVSDPIELIGDTVSVRKNSSYYDRLENLMEEIGGIIYIDTVPGQLSTDEIIEKVVNDEIKFTVADNNIASINSAYYEDLDIDTDVSFSQQIAWAVRKNSPNLLSVINEWISLMKEEVDYYVIYNKYFENQKFFQRRAKSELFSINTDKISPYDSIIQKYAAPVGWDWRLISAIIYQESEFDSQAESWAGAKGLMQMMTSTAQEMGANNVLDPKENIKAGISYLHHIWQQWVDIPDSVQRIKFTLAAYNCGYYHVVDAQSLAKKNEKNSLIWDNNVEDMILKLTYPQYYQDEAVKYGYVRGREPYAYVKEVYNLYEQYKELVPS
jgi:membrane-bound lytic murein transglycosylase F